MASQDSIERYCEIMHDAYEKAAVKEGLDLAAVRKRVTLNDWNTKVAGDDKYRRRAFHDFFVVPGIEQAYKEAKGEPLTE